MGERIAVLSKSETYVVRPFKNQTIMGGFLNVDDKSGKGFNLIVIRERREIVEEALKNIENLLENQDLAVVPSRLNWWIGTFETSFIPPIEVVGPPILKSLREP